MFREGLCPWEGGEHADNDDDEVDEEEEAIQD